MNEPEAEGSVDDVKTEETAQAETEVEEIVAVSIGEPPPQAEPEESAPAWVKEVRKTNREQARKIRELESQLKAPQTQAAVPVLPKKPTLESHDYDEVKFESALSEWFDAKRKVDEAERSAKAKADDEAKTVQERHKAYKQQAAALKVEDFDDAEDNVANSLTLLQQQVLLQGSDSPHLVVYALGKDPAKLKELATIKDPVKFAFAISKLETQVQVTKRKPSTSPESPSPSGTARVSGAVSDQLARLEADAAKTGDRSKVVAFKRSQKAKG
jgi:hypothetical protein